MNEHGKPWIIAAYADGELDERQRKEIAAHLLTCPACRAEYEDLRALSRLLQTGALPKTSPAQQQVFITKVLARLPQVRQPFWKRVMFRAWRYAPLGLFAVWVFGQIVFGISSALLSLFPPELLPFASEIQSQSVLSVMVEALWKMVQPPQALQWVMNFFGQIFWVNGLTVLNIVLTLFVGGLFLAWTASFWAYRRTVLSLEK